MKKFQLDLARTPELYRAGYLISGFIQHTLTIREEEELDEFILSSVENMKIFEVLTEDGTAEEFIKWFDAQKTEEKLDLVKKRLKFKKKSKVKALYKYAAAACIAIALGLTAYFMLRRPVKEIVEPALAVQDDIQPGSLNATLKLSDGRLVALRRQQDTIVNDQIRITEGVVHYNNDSQADEYNEISIPRKGFYQLVLSDGTKVWLNSESSIKYPTAFNGAERRVTVTGETYFEVAKDPAKPFIVSVNGIEVRALGTAFNINAYSNEHFRTTLIEGSIKVSGKEQEKLVKPGEQLRIEDGSMKIIRNVAVDAILAWKYNAFKFEKTGLREAMRMMERWYGCNVIIDPDVKDVHFYGEISRSNPLSLVLKLLQMTGHIKYNIEGTTVRVTN